MSSRKASHVNLDALIPREDFEAATDDSMSPSLLGSTMRISELGPESIGYLVLRKPDFQRETANWTPERIADLVESFLGGDLIPSVILWRSPNSGNIFIIDGAHRLSALIAWVHDDYGDNHKSRRFFDNYIPPEQGDIAEATRKLINERVGSYAELSDSLVNSDTAEQSKVRMARNMSTFAIHLQWVQGGAEKAENSFFRINQKATPINDTELDMITARRKPNALAARAIIRAGTGHRYWWAFEEEIKEKIEDAAKDVYDLIFKPTNGASAKTADLPIAGGSYSDDSLRMVFELVNFVNKVEPKMWRENKDNKENKKSSKATIEKLFDDKSGEKTLNFINSTRKAVSWIVGNDPGSLGLHPAVYFYNATGKFQPAALLATVNFVQELKENRLLGRFTERRNIFEEFLVDYSHFLNQIGRRYGSMEKSVNPILKLYKAAFEGVSNGTEVNCLVQEIKDQSALRGVVSEITDEDRAHGRNFSRETKNWIYVRERLSAASRCGICGARLDPRSATVDHKIRKEDGGSGAPENGQLTHPYCNSGFKESINSSHGESRL